MLFRRLTSSTARIANSQFKVRASHSNAAAAAVGGTESNKKPSWARFRPELWRKAPEPSNIEYAPFKDPRPQAWVETIDSKKRGIVDLDADIWSQEIRKDILQRVVEWQRAKARTGRNVTKGRGDVSETTKKIYKQKGMGAARRRQRTAAPHMRGGGKAHGQSLRSFDISLPKKVRRMGLKVAFSAKYKEGNLTIINSTDIDTHNTKHLQRVLDERGFTRKDLVLFIGGPNTSENFLSALRNIPNTNYLPVEGANVKDILKHHHLFVTLEAVRYLDARLNEVDLMPATDLEEELISLTGESQPEEDVSEE